MAKQRSKRRLDVFTLRLSVLERKRLNDLAASSGTGAAAVIRTAVNTHCAAHSMPLVFDVAAP